MSKKSNSIVFMLVATVVNILLLIVFFILGFLLLNWIASTFPAAESMLSVLMLVVFILAIVLSFIVYSKLVKWANNKFNLEDKLDPLFVSKKNRRGRTD